ncbi:MAG: hypothetical protein LBQ89_07930 [Treponema sp.]|jgi:hypothetical protein|nr:hypothetical protein [Treponema sp.]
MKCVCGHEDEKERLNEVVVDCERDVLTHFLKVYFSNKTYGRRDSWGYKI